MEVSKWEYQAIGFITFFGTVIYFATTGKAEVHGYRLDRLITTTLETALRKVFWIMAL